MRRKTTGIALTQQRTPESMMRELADLRRRPVLCICHDESEDEEIDQDCADKVHELLSKLGNLDSLSVLVDSPGGDIDCAYRIVRSIRENADDVEVMVPRWAKSAATLICIGADQILLGSTGEMGPMDVQLPDPAGRDHPRSALETFQGLTQLRNYAVETLSELIEYFEYAEELEAPYCYERAEALFGAIVLPLYHQIDPHELGELGRYQAVSEQYALRIMKRWSYRDYEEDDVEEIARRLVWGYPTHGFVVDLHEARDLKLRADRLDPKTDLLCQELISVSLGLVEVCLPTQGASNVPVPNAEEE